MIRYSSSVHKSDWECSSKSVRGSFFVNPLYIKNLTNLTNLTTLQTLQPYRFLCRVPKGPHTYLCTLHKGGLPAPCGLHNLCSLSENLGLPRRCSLAIQDLLGCIPARLQFGGLRARAHAWAKIWHGGGPQQAHARMHECNFSSLLRAFQSNWEIQFWKQSGRLTCTVRGQSEIWNGNRVNRQK